VFRFIQAQPYSTEVLIVENGSQDRTSEVVQDFIQGRPAFRLLHETQRGKGLAVRRGMLEAQGEYRFMCDADLSMPIDEVNRFLPPVLEGCDIAIASREAPGSVRYNEPLYRHLGGRAINDDPFTGLPGTCSVVSSVFATAIEDLFSRQTLNGWSFDIELLFIARRRKYRIVEVPIPWYFNPESKLSVVSDALRMGLDILSVHRNAWQGKYD
jgi:glycosyltransferase involved in cell wall biosynthesis